MEAMAVLGFIFGLTVLVRQELIPRYKVLLHKIKSSYQHSSLS